MHVGAVLSPSTEPCDVKLAQLSLLWQFDVMAKIAVVSPSASPLHEVLADNFALLVRLLVGLVMITSPVAYTTAVAHVIIIVVFIVIHPTLAHSSSAASTSATAHPLPSTSSGTPASAST